MAATSPSTDSAASPAPDSPAPAQVALPAAPLRSAFRRSRPPTPALSPLSSPLIGQIPLSSPDEYFDLTPTSAVMHPHTGPQSSAYTPKVSFDTFENPNASMFSFTLQVKTEGYKRTKDTRVFLCAASPDESGVEALEWCLESLVQNGDELIVFRGVDEVVLGTSPYSRSSMRC
jgi:hypothetical protein